MTVKDLYSCCLEKLKSADIQDANFECDCLFEHFIGYTKIDRITKSNNTISQINIDKLNNAILKRIAGEPLQYILGSWEFMGFEFKVGEGVLIPRPETEIVVEKACEFIKKRSESCVVYDLCAGSGAIGLSVAKLNPDCRVYLFEKYDKAFEYLKLNAEAFNCQNAKIIKYDIFDGYITEFPKADLILSNPPYIESNEIPTLQKEVQLEPKTALDGGADGLDFYRCIHEKWVNSLNIESSVIMECGENQSKDIIDIFSCNLSNSKVYFDFNDIDRVVELNI